MRGAWHGVLIYAETIDGWMNGSYSPLPFFLTLPHASFLAFEMWVGWDQCALRVDDEIMDCLRGICM